jgi:Flp pilus assembly protein TadD
MKPLEPPDTHHLSSALGWLGLGLSADADTEIEKIVPSLRAHPDVLEVRWQISAAKKDWAMCLDLANELQTAAPDRASSWINRAYSLRRVEGGGLQAAQECLLRALPLFSHEAVIPFNLACYACQLGDLSAARAWLKKASSLASEAVIKKMALQDPDLEALWAELAVAT